MELNKGATVENGRAVFIHQNGLCRVHGYVANSSTTISTNETLFDGIPSQYRPSSSLSIPMVVRTSAGATFPYYGFLSSETGRITQLLTGTATYVVFFAEWKV